MADVKITKKQRAEVEALIYKVFDAADKSKINSDYYKELFAKMTDEQFLKFVSLRFPYKFHVKPFVVEPSMSDIKSAFDIIKVPLLEKVNMPYLYENKDGKPVKSKECLVVYIHHKKVQQFITKKNAMSTDISMRDYKTGLLTGYDKNGKTSDREMESLAVMGLDKTMEEFARPKADSMNAKNAMYNTISTTGQVSLKDLPNDVDDSLSKNLLNTYLLGAMLNSNLINQDYYLAYTIKNKQKKAVIRK